MPIAAIAEIVIGATMAEGVTAGLMIAGGSLTLVGDATGSKDLQKLGAVASLAAGVSGMTNGFTTNPFSSGGSDIASAANAMDAESADMVKSVQDAGASDWSPSHAVADAATEAPSFTPPTDLSDVPPAAPAGLVQNAMPPPAPVAPEGVVKGAMTPPTDLSDVPPAAPGVTDTTPPPVGTNPEADAVVHNSIVKDTDPGIVTKGWNWFKGLDNTSKLAVSGFIAKGLGSIGEFVGPKADEMKARAGVLNSQSAIYQSQLANMNKPATKVVFTPGAK